MLWSTKHRYPGLFYLSERKKCFPRSEYRDFDFQNSFLQKKASAWIFWKKIHFLQNRDDCKPFSQKKILLHIFLCGFPLIPINRNTSILRKFKKAISKFKKNAITISFMKNLNFISTNSSSQFITIYLYYTYVIICFFRLFLDPFGYSARNKILV